MEPLLSPEHPAGAAAALRVFAARRLDPGPGLPDLIASSDTALAVAALRAVAWTRTPVRAAVEHAYGSRDSLIRDAALETGLLLGLRSALAASRKLVASRAPSPAALVVVAMSGAPPDLDLLHGTLGEPSLRRVALRALGFAGSPGCIERILPWLGEPATARVAGEAFTAVTGIPIAGELVLVNKDEEDLPEEETLRIRSDLLPGRDVELPRPDPEAVAACWAGERGRFEPHARYIAGRRFSGEALRAALCSAPMRRRPALALELAVRSRRALMIDCRAWARDQLRAERHETEPLRSEAAYPLDRILVG